MPFILYRALHKAAINPPSGGGASAPLKIKRILREIANYQKSPHPAIEIFPCENRLRTFTFLIGLFVVTFICLYVMGV